MQDPDYIAPREGVWSGSTLFVEEAFETFQKATKTTTLLVVGAIMIILYICLKQAARHPVEVQQIKIIAQGHSTVSLEQTTLRTLSNALQTETLHYICLFVNMLSFVRGLPFEAWRIPNSHLVGTTKTLVECWGVPLL